MNEDCYVMNDDDIILWVVGCLDPLRIRSWNKIGLKIIFENIIVVFEGENVCFFSFYLM